MMRRSMSAIAAAAIAVMLCAGAAVCADEPSYRAVFEKGSFKLNRDALKSEVPEGDIYRISPRVSNAGVWTFFPVTKEAAGYLEWEVKGHVRSSDGLAAGVGIRGAESSWSIFVFPDGHGMMREHSGKKLLTGRDFTVEGLFFPFTLSLCRDGNGSVIGRVNDCVVAAVIRPLDMSSAAPSEVTAVAFATLKADGNGTNAAYERLEVSAKGVKRVPDKRSRFEELFGR